MRGHRSCTRLLVTCSQSAPRLHCCYSNISILACFGKQKYTSHGVEIAFNRSPKDCHNTCKIVWTLSFVLFNYMRSAPAEYMKIIVLTKPCWWGKSGSKNGRKNTFRKFLAAVLWCRHIFCSSKRLRMSFFTTACSWKHCYFHQNASGYFHHLIQDNLTNINQNISLRMPVAIP